MVIKKKKSYIYTRYQVLFYLWTYAKRTCAKTSEDSKILRPRLFESFLLLSVLPIMIQVFGKRFS